MNFQNLSFKIRNFLGTRCGGTSLQSRIWMVDAGGSGKLRTPRLWSKHEFYDSIFLDCPIIILVVDWSLPLPSKFLAYFEFSSLL